MDSWFYLKVKTCKFLANTISALVFDREKRHALREKLDPLSPKRCVAYIKKRYTDVEPVTMAGYGTTGHTIWICWLQGRDNAPDIVKNCIHSFEQLKSEGMQVVVLTSKNLHQYAQLPAYIVEKWQKGKICHAHFTDILRVYLMVRYGGYWVDATCIQTAAIPRSIDSLPVFLFRSHGEFSFTLIQNCFLHSNRNHYIMGKWYAAMLAYWKEEDKAIHYFVHHLMFQALLQADDRFKKEYEKIPVLSDEPMHILLNSMLAGEPYTIQKMNEAQEASFIQKLSYKFPQELLDDKQSMACHLSAPLT
ncbi:capsular polysaccharide synthesis protein [Prevotella sp. E15-22]|uniref:capsular polysaccharide synthesis protein n=1 Tax=Prevotella sp. E15-22 TaxID=2937774 RepID=UPI0020466C1C|nr:capsular polysaccharide synthesis protein [Prevotella sp. E15-22]UPS44775.1 capsular polysaccharide synthesis protein [Prevotella sp. E15-22]